MPAARSKVELQNQKVKVRELSIFQPDLSDFFVILQCESLLTLTSDF